MSDNYRHMDATELLFCKELYAKQEHTYHGGHTIDMLRAPKALKSIPNKEFDSTFGSELKRLNQLLIKQREALNNVFLEGEKQRARDKHVKSSPPADNRHFFYREDDTPRISSYAGGIRKANTSTSGHSNVRCGTFGSIGNLSEWKDKRSKKSNKKQIDPRVFDARIHTRANRSEKTKQHYQELKEKRKRIIRKINQLEHKERTIAVRFNKKLLDPPRPKSSYGKRENHTREMRKIAQCRPKTAIPHLRQPIQSTTKSSIMDVETGKSKKYRHYVTQQFRTVNMLENDTLTQNPVKDPDFGKFQREKIIPGFKGNKKKIYMY